jgi:hypothetical protein
MLKFNLLDEVAFTADEVWLPFCPSVGAEIAFGEYLYIVESIHVDALTKEQSQKVDGWVDGWALADLRCRPVVLEYPQVTFKKETLSLKATVFKTESPNLAEVSVRTESVQPDGTIAVTEHQL